MHAALKILFSGKARILFNALIWLFIFRSGWRNNHVYELSPGVKPGWEFHLHFLFYNLFFVAVVYINSLWLMPAYLFRRKYLHYLSRLLLIVLFITICQSLYIRNLLSRYPGTDLLDFSSVAFRTNVGSKFWTTWFFTLPSVLLFVIFSGLWRLIMQLLKVNRQNEIARQQQMQAELDLLKSQINPHFLFNVLNSIYSLSLKKSDQTPAVVLQLSEILRYMLYETGQEFVSLDKEISVLKDYIHLEGVRISSNSSIQMETDIDGNTGKIAPAILITFVENAIKHGIDSMSGNAYVYITVKAENRVLYFSCRNNYKTKPARQEGGGIGINNVKKRLALLYPGSHELSIEDEQDIFTVSLTLNMRS